VTALAVACSTALVAGTIIGYRSAEATARRLLGQWLGNEDISIVSNVREAIDPSVAGMARETPGVAVMRPWYTSRLQLKEGLIQARSAKKRGFRLPFQKPKRELSVVGVDPAAEQQLADLPLAEGGRFLNPDGRHEIVVRLDLAKPEAGDEPHLGLLGTQVVLEGVDGRKTAFTIVGVLATGDMRMFDAYVRASDLRELLPSGGRLARVGIGLADKDELETVLKRLREKLGFHVDVQPAQARHESVESGLEALRILFRIVTVVALIVAAFVVWGTMSVSVAERLGNLGLLRTIGASRGQLFGFVLLEGVVFGVGGVAVGVPLGGAASWVVIRHVIEMEIEPVFVFGTEAILLAVACAVVTALVGSLWPAIRAATVSPLTALRPQAKETRGWLDRWGWLLGLAAWGVAIPILYSRYESDVKLELFLYVGSPLLLVGAALLGRYVIGMLVWLLHWPVRIVMPGATRLAMWGLRHDRPRAAGVACALMMAAALAIDTACFSESLVSQWDDKLETVPHALVMSNQPFSDEVVAQIIESDEVKRYTALRTGQVKPVNLFESRRLTHVPQVIFLGVEKESLMRLLSSPTLRTQQRGTPVADYLHDLENLGGKNEVLITDEMHRVSGLEVGDRFVAEGAEGNVDLRVAGFCVDLAKEIPLHSLATLARRFFGAAAGRPVIIVGTAELGRRAFGFKGRDILLVQLKDATRLAEYQKQVDPILDRWRLGSKGTWTEIWDFAKFQGYLRNMARKIVTIFSALNMVALLTATMGVAALMLSSVVARRREIGLMRALGMTPGQLRRMIFVESGLIGLVGAAMAVGLGLWAAHASLFLARDLAGWEPSLVIPLGWIIPIVGVTAAMATVAGTVAASRAAAYQVSNIMTAE